MSLLQLLLFLLLSSDLLLLSSANSITISLSRVPPPSTNPLENLKYHADASLARAHHLIKCPNEPHVPLYPRYGFYSSALSFGTPPQTLRFFMDTGSSLVWFPCTHHYNCSHCDAPDVDPAHIPTFIPESSSSYINVTCRSPQCKWLFRHPHCNENRTKCRYIMNYGLGYTFGQLSWETLTFPGLSVHNFIVGCSFSSDYQPEGVVGFGRTRVSLPTQLGLTSFSYCMVSHDFDDNATASSDLVLTTTRGGCKDPAANYTPFVSNGAAMPDYYYVSLQSISIGGVQVNVPPQYVVPDTMGNGGTILDSGTTFTVLEQSMFDLVFNETVKQVGKRYEREKKIENETGLEPCYTVGKNKLIKLPQFTFHFQGNTKMVLPLENSFLYATDSVVCMTIMNLRNNPENVQTAGPVIILGNYLQQDYYIKYDLECNRLWIRQQKCK